MQVSIASFSFKLFNFAYEFVNEKVGGIEKYTREIYG